MSAAQERFPADRMPKNDPFYDFGILFEKTSQKQPYLVREKAAYRGQEKPLKPTVGRVYGA